jgi:predicted secreted hydrolase
MARTQPTWLAIPVALMALFTAPAASVAGAGAATSATTISALEACPVAARTLSSKPADPAVSAVGKRAASSTMEADEAAAPGPGPGVHLPADEAPHHGPVEWWYFNGHLRAVGPNGQVHCYGFEYVTFQFILPIGEPTYVADFSVTDLDRKAFQYAEKNASYPVPATKDRFALHTGPWSMAGGSGSDALHASVSGYAIDLHLRTTEPAALEGTNGLVSLGPIGGSDYYSWTSLLTSGTIVDHGVTMKVSGISWMDHQWGQMALASGAGWDWFSIQLSDGEQFMVYFIRDSKAAIVHRFATEVTAAGKVTHLSGQISERALSHWRSPASGITYSSGWDVSLPGAHFTIAPYLRGQELDLQKSQGNSYWEGDVSVTGTVDGHRVGGVGYTEINPPGGLL